MNKQFEEKDGRDAEDRAGDMGRRPTSAVPACADEPPPPLVDEPEPSLSTARPLPLPFRRDFPSPPPFEARERSLDPRFAMLIAGPVLPCEDEAALEAPSAWVEEKWSKKPSAIIASESSIVVSGRARGAASYDKKREIRKRFRGMREVGARVGASASSTASIRAWRPLAGPRPRGRRAR